MRRLRLASASMLRTLDTKRPFPSRKRVNASDAGTIEDMGRLTAARAPCPAGQIAVQARRPGPVSAETESFVAGWSGGGCRPGHVLAPRPERKTEPPHGGEVT